MEKTKEIKLKKRKFHPSQLGFLFAIVLVFVVWEAVVFIFRIPDTLLPSMTSIIKRLFSVFREQLAPHMWATFKIVLIGMGIGAPCGILLASVISQFKTLEKMIYPYVVALVTVPMVAILPIVYVWVGFGALGNIIVVICQVIPIVTLNAITGFTSIERAKVQLGEAVGATKLQIFVKTVFPNALPYVFTGIRLGSIFATTTTISSELIASSEGLGNRVVYYARYLSMDTVFSCIILIAVIGLLLFQIFVWIERRIVVWK